MDTIGNSKKYKAKIVLAGFQKVVVIAVKLRPLGRGYKA